MRGYLAALCQQWLCEHDLASHALAALNLDAVVVRVGHLSCSSLLLIRTLLCDNGGSEARTKTPLWNVL